MGDYAVRFHRGFTLAAERSALVLIDLQHATAARHDGLGRLLTERGEADTGRWRFDRLEQVVLPAVQRLLQACRGHGGTVVFVTLGSERDDYADVPPYLRPLVEATGNRVGSPTHALLPGLVPRLGELLVNKRTASAFLTTDLHAQLRGAGVDQLVLAGVSTNSCVESTARDGADLGFQCIIVDDACSCASEPLHRATLENFARLFGRVATTDQVLTELAADAG